MGRPRNRHFAYIGEDLLHESQRLQVLAEVHQSASYLAREGLYGISNDSFFFLASETAIFFDIEYFEILF